MAHIGFGKLKAALAAKGATDPAGLAANIGDEKYGKAGMKALATAGRKKKKAGDLMKLAKTAPPK